MTCTCLAHSEEKPIKLPNIQKPAPTVDRVEHLLQTHRDQTAKSPTERAFEELAKLAGRLCDAPMAAIILQLDEGARVTACVGIGQQAKLDGNALLSFVPVARPSLQVMADAAAEPGVSAALAGTDAVVGLYAAAPLQDGQGRVLGLLCVMDRQARDLHARQREALVALARQASALLTLGEDNRQLREGLLQSRQHQQQQLEYQRLLELNNEQLSTRIRLDMLTGLANRDTFASALDTAVEQAQARGESLSMAVADIDHFKAINDTHGHPAGDRVLVQVARVLRAEMDDQVLAARQGGEEFVLLMPAHALAAAVRRCDAIQQRLRASGLELPVTLSIGVAERQPGESAQQLYVRADAALYLAKRSGRNRVVAAFQPDVAGEQP